MSFIPTIASLSTAPPGARIFLPTVFTTTFTRSDFPPESSFTVAFEINSYIGTDGSTSTFTISQFQDLGKASLWATMLDSPGADQANVVNGTTYLNGVVFGTPSATSGSESGTFNMPTDFFSQTPARGMANGTTTSSDIPASDPQSGVPGSKSSNGALIGGIVAGAVVGLLIFVGAVVLLLRGRSRQQRRESRRTIERWEKTELDDSPLQRSELDAAHEVVEMEVPKIVIDPVELPTDELVHKLKSSSAEPTQKKT